MVTRAGEETLLDLEASSNCCVQARNGYLLYADDPVDGDLTVYRWAGETELTEVCTLPVGESWSLWEDDAFNPSGTRLACYAGGQIQLVELRTGRFGPWRCPSGRRNWAGCLCLGGTTRPFLWGWSRSRKTTFCPGLPGRGWCRPERAQVLHLVCTEKKNYAPPKKQEVPYEKKYLPSFLWACSSPWPCAPAAQKRPLPRGAEREFGAK